MEDYPRNLAEFEARFATEQACREYLCQLRWPEGFRCPRCGHDKAWAVRTALLECAGCGHQASPTAGTIFQDTRQPLQSWFRAMWWLTSQKNGASALGLQRVLGLGSYKTAWTWLHKLRRAMVRPGRDRLSGRVEVDETYLGGLEEGVRGRQTDAKALIVVAAEEDGAGIGRVRIRTIPNASGDSLMAFVGESIEPGSVVHTDGWLGYEPLEGDGYRHEVSYLEGQPARASKLLPRVHRVVSLVKPLDTGHASRSGQSRASRLLPRRIRLPLQPPQVQKSRQALLPPGSTGRRRATGTLQIAGRRHRDTRYGRPQHVGAISQYLSQVNTHLDDLWGGAKIFWFAPVGRMIVFCKLAGFFAFVLLFAGVANAQFSGAIEGYVKDGTGAVMPGAEVIVTDENLGLERTITSNETGLFRIAELPAGSYQVSVTSGGFQTWSTTGLLVRSNETRTLYPEMEVGEVTTSVTVEAATSAVNTTEVDNSSYIAEESIRNQPLPRNTIWQLSTLVPGVTGSGETSATNGAFVDNYQGEMGLKINASGQRQGANLVMLNGSYAEVPSRDGTIMVSPIPDSLQEFRVEAQSFSAAKGRSSGAFMELVTKSGTNEWHGTVGYLYTNDNLSARTIAQSSLTDFAQKDFWTTIGGPIKKNKTFIFGSFDILRATTAATSVGTAETPQFRSYVTTNFPQSTAAEIFRLSPAIDPTGDVISVGQLKLRNPGQFDDLSTIPDDLPAVGTVNVSGSVPRRGEQYQVRVDHHFSDNDRFFGYYYKSDGTRQFASLIRPAFTRWSPVLNTWWKGDWNHVFSPTFMNSMSFRYSRQTGEQQAGLGEGAVDIPNISVSGTQGFGAWGPGGWTTPTWEWKDMATLNKGDHTIQIGAEYVRPDDTVPWRKTLTRPTFGFSNLLDFAQDKPTSQFGPTVNLSSGQVQGAFLSYHTAFAGFFFQDNWRLRPGFSLNIGVRVDNYGEGIRYTDASDPGCYLFAGQGNNTMERIANGFAECRQTATDRLPWLVSPRIGFAWDVSGNGSLSVRGGYGMYRDRIAQNWFSTLNLLGPPATATPSLNVLSGDTLTYGLGNWGDLDALAQDVSPDIWPKPDVAYEINERGGVKGLRSSILSVDQNMKIPTAHSWMLSIQKRIGSDSVAEINYTGSADHNLTSHTDINRFPGDLLDGRLDRLNPFFGAVQRRWTGANSNAHLLSLLFQKRHTSGRSIRFVYTYAKVLDQFSTSGLPQASVPSTPVFDVWNLRAQRGRADFDIRQRLTFDAMWQARVPEGNWYSNVVNGWRLGTLGILQTGLPYTVQTTASFPSGDFNADGLNNDLPNAPAFGNSLSGSSKSDFLGGLFTAADFPTPARGLQGNLGRNTFTNPGLLNINLLITREFKIPWRGEGAVLQVRGEIFNAINRANLDRVRSNMVDGLFGRVTNSIGPRSAQLGLRFVY